MGGYSNVQQRWDRTVMTRGNVEGDSTCHVEGDVTCHVEGDVTCHVEGDSTCHVEGDSTCHVEGDSTCHVEGDSTCNVEGDSTCHDATYTSYQHEGSITRKAKHLSFLPSPHHTTRDLSTFSHT